MFTESKENLKKIIRIAKMILKPKTLIWIIVVSVLPVGIALKWKEIKKEWKKENKTSCQTSLEQWVE